MLLRVITLLLSASILGCSTGPVTLPRSQLEGITIQGLDRAAQDECVGHSIASIKIHTASWRAVAATPIMTGQIHGDSRYASGPPIPKENLRFVRLTLRGQGIFGDQTSLYVCMFELRDNRLRFLQSCLVSTVNKTDWGQYCPLTFRTE
jgi:hypothetical protein